jgi:arabinogalactan endo-1,4-beta-galactosidase
MGMNAKHWARAGFAAMSLIFAGASAANADYAFGADVSWLPRSEALGVKFYDATGKAGDCLAIMKDMGINSIRLRTWVHPNMNDNFSGHCSTAETIAMAVRCKALGLRVMIDFHYNDTWTSVGSQGTPANWQGKSYAVIKDSLSNYVTDFCTKMKAAGVTPEWFQNGNEINSGILVTPTNVGGVSAHPDQMTGLLNAGYDAIKAVFPTAKVLIHTAQPQNTAGDAMLTAFLAHGGKMDAIGFSSYAGSGNVDALATDVKKWHDKYNLETYIVEIGNSSTASNQIMIQKWNDSTSTMNKPCEGGTFYWEPEAYGAPGNWSDAIFDATGKPMSCWAAYKLPLTNPCKTSEIQASGAQRAASMATLSRASTGELFVHKKGQFQFKTFDMSGRSIGSGTAMDVADLGARLKTGLYVVKIESMQGTEVLHAVQY